MLFQIAHLNDFEKSNLTPLEHSAPTRIAIFNNNPIKAELLSHYCLHQWSFIPVVLDNSAFAIEIPNGHPAPDLLLVCINTGQIAPLSLMHQLSNIMPTARLVVFTEFCNEYLIHLLSTCHYRGLIWEYETTLKCLGHILRGIKDGIRFVSPTVVHHQNQLRNASDAFPKLLSKRHLEILGYITHSLSDAEIALRIGCARSTVLCHRQRIMQKLNIHSTPKLIRYGIMKGFGSMHLSNESIEVELIQLDRGRAENVMFTS